MHKTHRHHQTSSSSSSSSDDENDVWYVRRPKRYQKRRNYLEKYDELEFYRRFRITKNTFRVLLAKKSRTILKIQQIEEEAFNLQYSRFSHLDFMHVDVCNGQWQIFLVSQHLLHVGLFEEYRKLLLHYGRSTYVCVKATDMWKLA